jgi:transcriptional regulator with XRE-family HTH domain
MGTKPRYRPKRLPEKLLHIRKVLNLSQGVLADVLDLDLSAARISEYEHDRREPSLITLLAYGYLVGIPIDHFIDDSVDLPSQITIKRRRKRITLPES